MHTCKFCREQFSFFPHHCGTQNRRFDEDDSSDFLLSMAVGFATDSPILGAMAGGDLAGGIVGEMLRDSVDSSNTDTTDTSSSNDSFSGGGGDFGGGGSSSDW